MMMGYSKSAFEKIKSFGFTNHINNALDKYQSNIKLARLNRKLSELMETDPLTSVKNRAAYDGYMTKLNNMVASGIEEEVAVVMCDINNLKVVNDNLGHDSGDIYIQNCCHLMCKSFKHSPIFRTGGDEFVVVISTADFPVRNELLDEMRAKMEELRSESDSPLTNLSIATGMAVYDPDKDKDLYDVVKRADALMYLNKAEMKFSQL